jgi:adenylosuccinate synthase
MAATIIVDAFWGDAGKGKFCAYLARKLNASLCVRAGTGTNAGHSVYLGDRFYRSRMVPVGSMTSKVPGLISSGVAVDPKVFLSEVEEYHLQGRVFVDRRCPIIEAEHISYEMKNDTMQFIDSTKSGTGKAQADFVMRCAKQAKDEASLAPYVIDGIKKANNISRNREVIIEGSQATFLSLSASDRYPFVTSGNCTTAAFIDDVSLNWKYIKRVVLLVKCLPTSVGNGPLPYELNNSRIEKLGLQEFGLNTGREKRRCGQIPWSYLKYSASINGPTDIALTFCDQYCAEISGKRTPRHLPRKLIELIDKVEKVCDVPVSYLSTGPQMMDVIELRN